MASGVYKRDLSRVTAKYRIAELAGDALVELRAAAMVHSKNRRMGAARHWAAVAEACDRRLEEIAMVQGVFK